MSIDGCFIVFDVIACIGSIAACMLQVHSKIGSIIQLLSSCIILVSSLLYSMEPMEFQANMVVYSSHFSSLFIFSITTASHEILAHPKLRILLTLFERIGSSLLVRRRDQVVGSRWITIWGEWVCRTVLIVSSLYVYQSFESFVCPHFPCSIRRCEGAIAGNQNISWMEVATNFYQ